ncbi:5'-nucleotidase [Schaalia meyeri]|uniref:5'-nucleotidase n=1 Tax=Schaalia meyeri TaxID=52773 RepID=UPI000682CD5F|nr:5'-nucleotidase [Schaalia meyeri]AKU65598.1 5'-nucleotidase [Schaalia meyeri]OFQ22773.1 5'-nucleotidase [Actinomyces sp. HMSC062G12]
MPGKLELERALVIGVASSALFDLRSSDAVFRQDGEQKYREYQRDHLDNALAPGVAFPFIRRLLTLNDLSEDERLVEVVILSRNDPETGLRVMRSVKHHGLDITRAIFMQGRSPYRFMEPLRMSLFLSANETDVREAIRMGFAAGHVVGHAVDDGRAVAGDGGTDLCIAFDFDGVLADDSAERIYQEGTLEAYQENESALADVPLTRGPLAAFLEKINHIQRIEDAKHDADPEGYERRVRVAVVTARSAPAHERAINSIRGWGLRVNDAFFLGGINKGPILGVLQPHIFFDDQRRHVDTASDSTPSVHIPFGELNRA